MTTMTPLTSRSLAPQVGRLATREWPRLARLLAAAAVIGAIIGSVG